MIWKLEVFDSFPIWNKGKSLSFFLEGKKEKKLEVLHLPQIFHASLLELCVFVFFF